MKRTWLSANLDKVNKMSHERVKEALTQYVRNPPPGYAFLLEGGWGVGKSHFWRQFQDKELGALERTDISLSVAGLSTLEDLENALFLASVENLAPQVVRETASVVWKTALRIIKVDPKDIKLRADVKSGTTIVCIDDVERFAGDFKVLLGFIKGLLDDAVLHVVMIGDEKRALVDLTGYDVYRERIVGKWITVPPDTSGVYDSVANGYSDPRVRAALKEVKEAAMDLFAEKRLTNLRTLRSILDEINALLLAINWPADRTPHIEALLSAVTFQSMALAKDASTVNEVARVFLMSEMSLGAAMFDSKKKRPSAGGEPEQGQEKKDWRALINELGFTNDIYQWPSSPAFTAYVGGGPLDANGIAGDFMIFGDHNPEESLLKQLESYRTMDDATFAACIDGLKKQVENHELMSLHQVWNAWTMLSHLARIRVTPWSTEECRDFFLQAIHTYDPTGAIHPAMEQFDRPKDDSDNVVWAALEELQEKIEAAAQAEVDLQQQKALVDGIGEVSRISGVAPFANADAQDIYNRLAAAGREGVLRVTKFYARRRSVVNIQDKVAPEVPFANTLADIIEQHVPAGQLNLDQAAWKELSEKLRGFVDWVSPKSA